MPLKFWPYASQTATYLINILPTSILSNKSPFQCLYQRKPSYSHLKIFGCSSFPFLRPYNSNKLEYWSKECVFMGYSSSHKGYLCFDKETNRIYISRHVTFNENSFPFHNNPSNNSPSPFPSNSTHLISSFFRTEQPFSENCPNHHQVTESATLGLSSSP